MKKTFTRCMAWLLILFMLATDSQVQVFASTLDTHVHTEDADTDETHVHTEDEDTDVDEPHVHTDDEDQDDGQDDAVNEQEHEDGVETNGVLGQIEEKIQSMLQTYNLRSGMSRDEMAEVIFDLDENQYEAACDACLELNELSKGLTDAEYETLVSNEDALTVGSFYSVLHELNTPATVADGNYTPANGVSVSVKDATSTNESNGTITVTVKGSGGLLGIGASAKTTTITIKNTLTSEAAISFAWQATSVNSLTINGVAKTGAAGNVSEVVAANGSFTVVITTGKNSEENKLVMSNFKAAEVNGESKVTLNYDSSVGSVTANGTAVPAGQTATGNAKDGINLVAECKDGTEFIGWIDDDSKMLMSPDKSYNIKPNEDMSVTAAFASKTAKAWFKVNGYYYNDLTQAVEKATSLGVKTIILAGNGTLPAGDYEIPAGVTLLVPFDSSDTLCAEKPQTVSGNDTGWVQPTAYRTLNMASGANIKVNGAISLSGKVYAAHSPTLGAGSPTGPTSFIHMESGSSITLNKGANLYAWGYITGAGKVTAESGSTVYECFQLNDWRGGTATSGMKNKVFPMSQYYVQNIEVPLKITYGAVEKAYSAIHARIIGVQGTTVPFFGTSGAMFQLSSGSITKRYDGSKDRLVIEVDGNISISPMKMDVPGGSSINSVDYNLAINSNITVQVNGGGNVTISQDVAMLPGSQILIEKNGTVKVASGTKVFLYDADEWGGYAGSGNQKLIPIQYAPSKTYTRTEADLVDAEIRVNGKVDASEGQVYTTKGGANVYSTGGGTVILGEPGTDTVTKQYIYEDQYVDIPVTPIKLKDDRGYLETGNTETAGAGTYTIKHGNRWHSPKYTEKTEDISTVSCTTNGEQKITCDCGYTDTIITEKAWGHDEETIKGKAATCTEKGLTDGKKCKTCGQTTVAQTEIPSKGHTEVTDKAVAVTCTTDGLTEGKHCSVCSETIVAQETIKAKGHTEVTDKAVAATCTTTGLTEGKHCSVCNEKIVPQNTEPALGHMKAENTTETNRVNPTCAAEGKYDVVYECTRCHFVMETVQTVTIEKLPHTEVADEAVAPTCTEKGKTAGSHCSVCKAVINEQKEIAANGHKNGETKKENEKAATCTTDGSYDLVTYCSVCKKEASRTAVTVTALGHNPGTAVQENRVEATCYKEGSYNEVVRCTRCTTVQSTTPHTIPKKAHTPAAEATIENKVEATCQKVGGYDKVTYCTVKECHAVVGTEHVEIPKTDHNVVEDKAVEATCTTTGLTAGSHCKDCNEVIVKQETVAKKEHIKGTAVKENEVKATCEKGGSYDSVVYCTVCKTELSRDTKTTDKLEHIAGEPVKEKEVPATCYAKGSYELVTKCSNCGYEMSRETKTTEKVAHTPAEKPTIENEVKATCETDGKYEEVIYCTVKGCGDVISRKPIVVKAKGHTEVDDEAKAPTCTETGLTAGKHCSVCEKVIVPQETVNALGHKEVVVKAVPPTCTEAGLTAGKSCSVCNKILVAQLQIKPLGHTEVVDEAKAPTCTAPGLTAGSHCERCNKILVAQLQIKPLGHKEVVDEAKAPTCLETGLTAGKHCERCKEVLEKQETVKALGHDIKTIEKLDATCEEWGHTAGSYCGRCDYVPLESQPIEPTDHEEGEPVREGIIEPKCDEGGSYDSVVYCTKCRKELHREGIQVKPLGHEKGSVRQENRVEATCYKEGSYLEVTKCKRCGKDKWKDPKTIQKLAHTPGEVQIENKKAATCEADGGYDKVTYCTVKECGAEVTKEHVVENALGHKEVVDKAVAATCTTDGKTMGSHCERCEKVIVEQTITKALGHTEVVDKAVAATCTKAGLTEGKHCSVCNKIIIAQAQTRPLGHKEVVDEAVEATCTTAGLTEGKHCERCKEVLKAQETITAKGHTEKDPVKENVVESTCEKKGSYDSVVYCSVCNGEVSRTAMETKPNGHTETTVEENRVEATCQKAGSYDTVVKCTVKGCEKELSRTTHTIPKKAHTYGDAATCTTDQICKICKTVLTEKLGHDYKGETTVEAKCETAGTKVYTCSRCDDSYQEEIKALGHDYEYTATKEPTCTEDGEASHSVCKRCKDETDHQIIPMLGHDWKKDSVIKAATCTEAGKDKYVCARENCGAHEERTVEALGHTEVLDKAVAATCTKPGLTVGKHCSVCDKILVAQLQTRPLGHRAGNVVVENKKAATCAKEGSYENVIYCTVCNSELSREKKTIEKLEHIAVIDKAVEATCTKTGLTEGKHCSECEEVLVKQEVVKAKGHTEVIDKGIKATCTQKGLTEGKHCSVCKTILVAQAEVRPLSHKSVTDKAVDPTCTTTGLTEGSHCSVCEKVLVKQKTVNALEHKEETIKGKDATCTETGLRDGIKCSRCEEILLPQAEIPAKGHREVTDAAKAATCTEAGLTEGKHCSVCNKITVAQLQIKPLGHKAVTDEGKAATCTEAGLTEGSHCSVCDKIIVAQLVTKPLGHKTVVDEGKEATCTTAGKTEGSHCERCEEVFVKQEVIKALDHKEEAVKGKAATCTEKGLTDGKKCSRCEEILSPQIEIPAKGHTKVTDAAVAATCTTAGLTEGSHCSVCNKIIVAQLVTKPLGHKAVTDKAVEATCTTAGKTEGSHCSVCNKIIVAQLVTKPLGHKKVVDKAVEATCKTTGLTEGSHCSRCEEVLVAQETVDALGHKEETIKGKAATCTEKGLTDGKKCSRCEDILLPQTEIPAKGHVEVTDAAKAATCTEAGLTKGSHCSVCNKILVAQLVTKPLGHKAVTDKTVAATCTTAGLTEGSHCSVCNKIIVAQLVTKPLGHKAVTDKAVEATCTETGLTAGSHCERCETVLVEPEIVKALGHKEEKLVGKAATCTEKGLTDGKKCSRCEDILLKQVEIPAKGHTKVTDAAKAATCTEVGLTEGSHCSVCNKILVAQLVTKPLGHKAATDKAVAATCTTAGLTEGSHCSVCNKILVAQLVTKPLGHKTVTDKAVDATCTETGLTEGSHCSVCKTVIVAQEVTPANGHKSEADEAKLPTCTETGLTAGSHCSVCKQVLVKQETVNAKGHTEVTDKAVTPTCTATGLTAGSHCSVCNKIIVAQLVTKPLGHEKVVDKEIKPTCTTTGLTEGSHCSRCSEILVKQEVVKANGHTEVTDKAVAATCTETGLTEGSHCSVCSTVLEAQETVKALGHKKTVDEAVAATCTETGLTEGSHCSRCEEILVKQETVNALGHKEVPDKAVEPTCTETGLTAGSHCSRCSEVIVAQEVVNALGHDWDKGVTTKYPTCTEKGEKTFTCETCDGTRIEDEDALGHSITTHEKQLPTYKNPGWEAYESCDRCDYTTKVEIPALGEPVISTFDAFIENLAILEGITDTYVKKVSPGKDPVMLMIKYIRTGVERYNSGSWNIMAGYEDASFAKYVEKYETDYNLALEEGEELMAVTGLKNLELITLPNGDIADIGHVFGTMDITYTNASSEDHADVAGWGGDIADLLSASDQYGLESDTLEGMVAEIDEKYFKKTGEELGAEFGEEPIEGSFSQTDANGDIDGYYIMKQIYNREYSNGVLTDIFSNYMTSSLTKEQRAGYFLKNRLNGVSLRTEVRDAVYNEYVTNGVITTLEGTREYQSSKEKLDLIRKACCYVWADYLCRLAGDYVEIKENNYFSVFSTESSTLAPGITQQIKLATTADNKQMKFYLATADLSNEYVSVYANYKDNDPAAGWGMARLTDQMNAAQNRYGNTESAQYIPNYNVIAGVNASGYNMSTGQPSGLLTMNGVEYSPITSAGFFAILDDGTAMIGSQQDYYTYKDRIQEAVGSFGGTPMIKDGKIVVTSDTYGGNRASRAAVGITKSGKVVFMVLDGRQGDYSCGGTDAEVAQIMLEAGCVDAIHLDGGGSATYAARPEGEDAIRVVSSPSDGAERSVSSSLMMVSTAPSSTAFERAVLNCEYSYFATETSAQVTATALSATGNLVDMPEGTTWAVSDESVGTISEDGIFTALAEGTVDVNLMLDGAVIGTKKMHVVKPDNVYFEKESISAIYGQPTTLPVRAVYEGKPVKISEKDVVLALTNEISGTLDGFKFTPAEDSGLRKTKIMAALAHDEKVTSYIDISLYRADEASFNFDEASGGDYQLAWDREVSNSTLEGTTTYRAVDMDEDMVTSYTFAIDMSKIDIPEKLEDLTYMLPGADLENASAWNFLLQLAERISVLTNVTAEFYFDEDFEVDYSELTVSNEYFKLQEGGILFDKETNKLTLKLSWVDQTEPIDADTANPLCILSGIKLTPKDGASWTSANVLSITNKGEISYDVYLRANALYTFAQNEENQQIFDLYPFVNPDDENEKGGHFAAIYKLFEDGYTLINSDKDGWVIESDGYAYYHEGQRYEGIRQVDGYYYDFGEDGINIGQKKYSGDMIDEKGNEYYIRDGLLKSGWIVLDEDVRYYNPDTFIREELEIDETPSTCIIDGYCIYKNKAGETRRVDYDDAGGHEYEKQADGSYVCSVCGHVRIEMADCTMTLTNYVYTYTGNAITPATKVVAKDGTVLTKPGQSTHPDYASEYKNNKEVGTASVTSTARKYGVYVDMTTWRGNAAGSVTATFEIRPDLPTNVTVEADKLTWTAAKAPGVTYVIYRSEDGDNWTEYGRTQDTTFALNPAEDAAKMFRLSTEKTVGGKVYASVSQTKAVGMANMVITSVNESGKPVMKWCKAANAVSYEVYRSTTKNGTYAKVFNTVNTSYTHVSATAGRTYYYYLKTIYADGSSSQSDIVEITCIKLDAINLFTGNRESDGRPTLKWLQLKGDVKEYNVYRATTKSGKYAKVFTTEKTSYTHISATPGRTYYYKVVALYEDGTTLESDIVSMKAKVVNIDFGLKVTNKTSGTYNGKPALSWKKTGAISYTVYRSRTQNGKYAKVFTTKGRTYTNSSAVQGVTYYYKVQAKFYDGTVVTSDIVSAKCKVVDTNLKLTTSNRSNGKPALSWRQLGAKYEIYRSTTKNGTYKKVFTTEGTTYCNSSATKGRTYYYKVRAKFADGTVVWSNIVSRKCK